MTGPITPQATHIQKFTAGQRKSVSVCIHLFYFLHSIPSTTKKISVYFHMNSSSCQSSQRKNESFHKEQNPIPNPNSNQDINKKKTQKRKRKQKPKLAKSSKIVIIGGGIGGLSAALSLQLAGFYNIHVYERQLNPNISISNTMTSTRIAENKKSHKRGHGYGLTLSYNTKGPLAKLGILEDLASRDTPSRSHYVFTVCHFLLIYKCRLY